MSDPSSDYADTEQHEGELDDAVAWGRSSDQQQKLEMFSTVTGADHATAEHVLDAHGWNMDRSVTFFMESGGVGHAGAPTAQGLGGTSAAAASRSAQAGPAAHRVDDPVELVDLSAIPGTSPREGTAPPSHAQMAALDGEDAALQRALAESMQTTGGGLRQRSARAAALASSPIQMDLGEDDDDAFMTPDEEDDLEVLQRHRESAQASASLAAVQADEWAGRPRARSQAQGAASWRTADDLQAIGQRMGINIPPAMAAGMAGGGVAAMGPSAAAAFQHAGGGVNGAMDRPDSMELPEGINLEEARMLEAAMLGVPYAGRIPNFAAEASAAETTSSPQAQAGRVVRQEQDAAYEESLRADRQKQAAAEQAARAAREAEEAATRQVAEAAASAAAQQQQLEQMLQRKRQGLPDEPDAADPEAVEIQVRLPGGSRMRRRFRRTNPLASLFDYIDLQSEGQDIQPGSYSLVTQFPRRRYRESTPGSLSSSGLVTAKQEAVLLERD